mmetsp:Transcript_10476/g.37208  ORF Transcript_10476/g.37208 Transcript_10476/m.37208 type:complete len:335 (-) Transcript_10476:5885-6889(-)
MDVAQHAMRRPAKCHVDPRVPDKRELVGTPAQRMAQGEALLLPLHRVGVQNVHVAEVLLTVVPAEEKDVPVLKQDAGVARPRGWDHSLLIDQGPAPLLDAERPELVARPIVLLPAKHVDLVLHGNRRVATPGIRHCRVLTVSNLGPALVCSAVDVHVVKEALPRPAPKENQGLLESLRTAPKVYRGHGVHGPGCGGVLHFDLPEVRRLPVKEVLAVFDDENVVEHVLSFPTPKEQNALRLVPLSARVQQVRCVIPSGAGHRPYSRFFAPRAGLRVVNPKVVHELSSGGTPEDEEREVHTCLRVAHPVGGNASIGLQVARPAQAKFAFDHPPARL